MKPLNRFQYNLAGMFLLLILYQICSSGYDSSEMAAMVQGFFSLYSYLKKG